MSEVKKTSAQPVVNAKAKSKPPFSFVRNEENAK